MRGRADQQTSRQTHTLRYPRLLVASRSRVSMPPRRSARLVELANPHFQLPYPPNVVSLLFSLLPLDARLRASEVCRGWRFLLNDASFWTHVHMGAGCRVNPRFLSDSRLALALLRAACVRAKGSLLSVDLSGVSGFILGEVPFALRWLDSATAGDKASLRDLVAPLCYPSLNLEQVTALCRTLPLCRVRCTVSCSAVEALPLLRREPPFALLTSRELFVANDGGDQALLDMTSALSVHKGMAKLTIVHAPLATRAVVGALVDAAISVGIIDVSFHECGLSQTALPALTRLLQSHGFECLRVRNQNVALFEGPGLPAFCDALRNCKSLQTLELLEVNLWADTAVAPPIIAALEGLPALQDLTLYGVFGNRADVTPVMQRAAGECLARLITRCTSLHVLNLPGNGLGEAGMKPIFEALRGNAGLVELTIWSEHISANFAHNVVLPAVLGNTRLRKLEGLLSGDGLRLPALQEVEDILEARRLADK